MSRIADLAPHGSSTAVITAEGRHIGHNSLAELADSLATGFPEGRGLGIIRCRNDLDTLSAYLAALRHGQVALLADADLSAAQIEGLAATYQAEWVADNGVIEATGLRGGPIDPRAAVLLSTSGSTGSPRQVVLSAANLDVNAAAIIEYLGIGSDERAITSLPFHYSYGLSVINSHLLAGATLLLTEAPLTTRAFWDLCRSGGVTSLAGVPTVYDILARLHIERMQLPTLRTLTQAGGRLAPDRVLHFARIAREKGWRLFVMYGQTEASPRMAYLPPSLVAEHPDCIGIPIPGGSLSLVDAHGNTIEGSEAEGELVYRGPNVMQGYASSRADLERLDPPAELNTGDLAVRNAQGLYRITGRLKRILKLHGHRVALDQLEQALLAAGHEVVCGGRDDRLVVAHRPGADAEAIRALALRTCQVPHTALRCVALETWPMTAAGKIAYHRLAELA